MSTVYASLSCQDYCSSSLQDGNGQFPFPKLTERGSTSNVASEGGIPDTSPEHTDAVLKGTI